MSDLVQQVTQVLLDNYAEHLVCSKKTDLCIEGFPRSANTFCVDFLMTQGKGNNKRLFLAHHTHSALNVELAILLKKPCVVLIREPVAALTSFAIYSEKEIITIAQNYVHFYRSISKWKNILIVDFELAINDFNFVIAQINSNFGMSIPLSTDLDKNNAQVGLIARERGLQRHAKDHGMFVRKNAVPNPEREKLKSEVKPLVQDFVSKHQEIIRTYEEIKQFDNYFV
jgi:hypothetical protein